MVRLDLSDEEYYIDWTHEREWRMNHDLEFEWTDVEILLEDFKAMTQFIEMCEKEEMDDLIKKVKGITTLCSVLY